MKTYVLHKLPALALKPLVLVGPPSIPEPLRWIIWVIVAVFLLLLIFGSLGVPL